MAYDVAEAFERIESQLIESMIRNLKKHQIEEVSEGQQWEQWQVAQLKELQRFKQRNKQHFSKRFTKINEQIKKAIKVANETGMSDEEVNILRAIKNGFELKRHKKSIEGGFFELNDRQLNVLIDAVTKDFEKVESSVLRFVNDQYRQIIFNAQVFATTGAGTYQQAIDMATKDFLQRGINCVEYKNGARHNIASYADMAIRTATKRAYLQGEGIKRKEWGITTVIVNKRYNACPLCLPFEGKVLIDDVWSGGKASDGPYPLMSTAIAAGMYHPNCKDVHTTYFPGVSTPPNDKFTNQDLENVKERQVLENKANHAKRQRKKFERLANNSLDADNIKKYDLKEKEWAKNTDELNKKMKQFEIENGFILNYNPGMNSLDLMGKRRRFSTVDKNENIITAKTRKVYGTRFDIWTQNKGKDFRDTIDLLKRELENYEPDNMPSFVVMSKDVMNGLAAYSHSQNVIFLNNSLISEENVKSLLSDGFFAATNFKELLEHELTHKTHWDKAEKLYKQNRKRYNTIESAKMFLDNNLRDYVGQQRKSDRLYVKNMVSPNAHFAILKGNVNELVADVNVLSKSGKVTDEMLLNLVKEVLSK